MSASTARVRLTRSGIVLGGEQIPLYSGSVHYWRLEREAWLPALLAVKKLGLTIVDTYVPWGVHETAPGEADFGERDPRLDVAAFLGIVHDIGLHAIVRPGPHINAELTFFGIPERVVWDPECQARSPQGNPVMLPMVPVGFPVPSYASEAFLGETERWFRIVAPRLAPLRYPEGPIVLLQIDNEGAFYFRDGVYDQDYRPEALRQYRAFLREKYRSDEALARAYGKRAAPFDEVEPPVIFDAENADDLGWHLDWAEFQENLLARSLERMKVALERAGFDEIPTFHNMPMGSEATPLSASRLRRVVDLVGLDYYHRATPADRLAIERRTTDLVTQCEGRGEPAFACEMGVGIPPFFFPVHDELDSRFDLMAALAYGLRAFNIYMAVDRDRWIGAPIDRHGGARPLAASYEKLIAALVETRFAELRRVTHVRIVRPTLKRRLSRALNAFSPATPALFAILGSGSRENCFEEDFGLGGTAAAEMDDFAEAFESELSARGVPFAYVGEGAIDVGLDGARWIICPTAAGVDTTTWDRLRGAAERSARITVGPRVPTRDGSLRPLAEPLDLGTFELVRGEPTHPHFDRNGVGALVEARVRELSIPVWPVSSPRVFATVHEDDTGAARLLFLLNPESRAERTSVRRLPRCKATDLLDGTTYLCQGGEISLEVPARTVRMLRIDLP